jgi:hypothetical protein
MQKAKLSDKTYSCSTLKALVQTCICSANTTTLLKLLVFAKEGEWEKEKGGGGLEKKKGSEGVRKGKEKEKEKDKDKEREKESNLVDVGQIHEFTIGAWAEAPFLSLDNHTLAWLFQPDTL